MSVLAKLSTRARRHGPLIVAVCVVACGHVGLDLEDREIGDGDGDTGSGAAGPTSGGRDSSSGGSHTAASGGAQMNSGGMYSSGGNLGGQPSAGGSELGGEGGELNEGGAASDGSGDEDGGGSCEPTCACSSDDSSDGVCAIECLQSPCSTSCEVSCEIATLETANTQLLIDCQEDATCETTGPSDGSDLDVTCTGGGSCIVNCGSAQTCSTSCEGSGTCELNCDNADACHLDCSGEGDCKVIGGILEDISCPLNEASECPDGAVVCGAFCE